MQPRLTIQASPAASSTTTSSAVRPEGMTALRLAATGPLGGRPLLIKRLTFRAVNEALEDNRTILDSGESAGIQNRPIVLKRFVNGAEGEAFYQKRAPAERPRGCES